ncbi:molecular chaperone [Phyllobacterium sp. 628]|uniref:fimbrial biogenesis chaperone n=1 Tax=Phyllobacterium sp. 628 TaxID=2718938 RepID=UPI001662726E|nr:molecular chaperone [Phyllobacterium sp. 628]QND53212.1 molecular chaperone [Phyllobacterium sp. 628]
MRSMLTGIGAMGLFMLICGSADAASLRVAPTNLEMVAPGSASVLTLTNEAKRPINVQIRVFRWTQTNGVEQLEPTNDVVVSPPSTVLSGNKDYLVRVIRVSKKPVVREESYRVIVDELPDPARRKSGTVALVVRYSIPVFFKEPDASAPKVTWTLKRVNGSLVLAARNNGDSRLRLSDLQLTQGGRDVGTRKGLVGYVLGGASMQWPVGSGRSVSGGSVALKAQSDSGPLDVNVAVNDR